MVAVRSNVPARLGKQGLARKALVEFWRVGGGRRGVWEGVAGGGAWQGGGAWGGVLEGGGCRGCLVMIWVAGRARKGSWQVARWTRPPGWQPWGLQPEVTQSAAPLAFPCPSHSIPFPASPPGRKLLPIAHSHPASLERTSPLPHLTLPALPPTLPHPASRKQLPGTPICG